MKTFNVVMTAPRLAGPAVAVLEAAGCAIHYMPPYPSAEAVAELVGRVQADGVRQRYVWDWAVPLKGAPLHHNGAAVKK